MWARSWRRGRAAGGEPSLRGAFREGEETRFAVLLSTDRAAIVPVVKEALERASIPYQSGMQPFPSAQFVFSVPEGRLVEARVLVAQYFGAGPLSLEVEEMDGGTAPPPPVPQEARFPTGSIQAVLALFLVHLAVLLVWVGPSASPRRLARAGGLLGGEHLQQPWRLVSSLFVHADSGHVFWNGVSMLVFAVALAGHVGLLRAGGVYLAAGIAGGLAAGATTGPGTVTVGSSGAVAGLFGAWVVLMLRLARHAPLTRRARLRAIGIAFLFLPSLVTPTTSGGGRVSVAAHLGGAAAGALCGLFLRPRGVVPPGSAVASTGPDPQ